MESTDFGVCICEFRMTVQARDRALRMLRPFRCRVFIPILSRNPEDPLPVDQVDLEVDKTLSLSMAPRADPVPRSQRSHRVPGVPQVPGVGVQVGKRELVPERVPHPARLLCDSTETCRLRKISLPCSPFAEKTSRSLIL